MKRRSILALVVLGLTFLSMPASLLAQAKAHRVLFAVTSPDEADWKLAMGNIRNLLTGLGADTEVEVVAFGPGVTILVKPSAVDAEIQALQAKHVRFVACENSMHGRNLKMTDLVDGAGSVPSGIVEVVTKQEQGWSYVKAGR